MRWKLKSAQQLSHTHSVLIDLNTQQSNPKPICAQQCFWHTFPILKTSKHLLRQAAARVIRNVLLLMLARNPSHAHTILLWGNLFACLAVLHNEWKISFSSLRALWNYYEPQNCPRTHNFAALLWAVVTVAIFWMVEKNLCVRSCRKIGQNTM